jgi:hypothetical protein
MGFSNFGVSALTVFTVMTQSNYSDLLAYITNANDSVTAWLFLVSLVVVSRFLLIGLPIAIISNAWIDIARQRSQRRLKAQQDEADDALLEYLHWKRDLKASDANAENELLSSGDQGRARLVRQAILRRLGTKGTDELRKEIVYVFNMFDSDGSGEIGLAELLAAFRRMGVDLTLREAETLLAETDEDGNGIVDVEEFVQMVEKMLSKARGYVDLYTTASSAGAAGEEGGKGEELKRRSSAFDRLQSARSDVSAGGAGQGSLAAGTAEKRGKMSQKKGEEEGEEEERIGGLVPVCCGLFRVSRDSMEPIKEPLSKVRRMATFAITAPGTFDECGNVLSSQIITAARLRNIQLQFGPGQARAWSAFSIKKGAIRLWSPSSDPVARAAEVEHIREHGVRDQVVFPKGAHLPGGQGVSRDLNREDITEFLSEFALVPVKITGVGSVHWMNEKMEKMGSMSEIVVTLCIVANTVGMACEHFQGNVDMHCKDDTRCPNNIVIMSEGWTFILSMSNYVFGAVFTIEAMLKIVALGFWRYYHEQANRVDLMLVVVSDVDMALSLFASSFFSISFLRLVRLVRVLRLANRFRRLRVLIVKVHTPFSYITC